MPSSRSVSTDLQIPEWFVAIESRLLRQSERAFAESVAVDFAGATSHCSGRPAQQLILPEFAVRRIPRREKRVGTPGANWRSRPFDDGLRTRVTTPIARTASSATAESASGASARPVSPSAIASSSHAKAQPAVLCLDRQGPGRPSSSQTLFQRPRESPGCDPITGRTSVMGAFSSKKRRNTSRNSRHSSERSWSGNSSASPVPCSGCAELSANSSTRPSRDSDDHRGRRGSRP